MLTDQALTLSGVSCAAGARPLFENLSLSVADGGWTMLTGPNGSGKTTLLRAVAGLIRPLAGQIRWRGTARQATASSWKQQFYYQGHANALKAELSALENLTLQVALDSAGPVKADNLHQAMTRVGLTRARHVSGSRLSAGQARRLNLARLVCCPRPLWLLDEPANALDQEGLQLLADLLDEHLDRGGCALVASHQPLATRHPPTRHDMLAPAPR